MNIADNPLLRPSGVLRYSVFVDGILAESAEESNLVVDGHKAIHAALLAGGTDFVTQFGVGVGAIAPAAGNSALSSPFIKALDSNNHSSNSATFAFSLGSGEANGMAISEFGLLTTAGALYARRVRVSPLTKTSLVSIAGTWTITFP